jgi:hypothetical protein
MSNTGWSLKMTQTQPLSLFKDQKKALGRRALYLNIVEILLT